MSVKVGPKGQITIEKEIRDKLGIKPGWRAVQIMDEGRLIVYFIPPPHNRSLAGVLAAPGPEPFPTEEDLDRAREAAWEDVMRQKYSTGDDAESS